MPESSHFHTQNCEFLWPLRKHCMVFYDQTIFTYLELIICILSHKKLTTHLWQNPFYVKVLLWSIFLLFLKWINMQESIKVQKLSSSQILSEWPFLKKD